MEIELDLESVDFGAFNEDDFYQLAPDDMHIDQNDTGIPCHVTLAEFGKPPAHDDRAEILGDFTSVLTRADERNAEARHIDADYARLESALTDLVTYLETKLDAQRRRVRPTARSYCKHCWAHGNTQAWTHGNRSKHKCPNYHSEPTSHTR